MNPNPFVEFPDMAGLTDQQFRLLLLYELIELRAEVRAVTMVLLRDTGVSSEEFDKTRQTAQDVVIAEMVETAKTLAKPPSRPPLN